MGLLRIDVAEIDRCEQLLRDAAAAGGEKVPKEAKRILRRLTGSAVLRASVGNAFRAGRTDEAVALVRAHPRWKRHVNAMTLLVVGVSLGAGVVGTLALIDASRLSEWAEGSESWPHVAGTIVASSVSEHVERRERSGQPGPRERTEYFADVRYRYEVDGRSYDGTTVTFDGAQGTEGDGRVVVRHPRRDRAEAVVARYPVGSDVDVYYDPAKPTVSVLEPGDAGHGGPLVFGIGALLLAVGFPIVVYRQLRDAD